MEDRLYTIGEFARITGLTEKALRIYDKRGLLPPRQIDEATGYRRYADDQVDDARLVAMLRAIDMPLADISEVLATPGAQRSAAVARYWYRIERELDDYRENVRALQRYSEEREHGMSHTDAALEQGRGEGVVAAIASLAAIDDLDDAANAYGEAMKAAYWTDRNIPMVTAVAYAGISRMLAAAPGLDSNAGYRARSAAKGLSYDLASFTWPGWDEEGVDLSEADAAAGLSAARSNLAMAVELQKGDLPISRAYWMLGAHLLTAGEHAAASSAFAAAADSAGRAGAAAEVALSVAFAALADLAAGKDGADKRLAAAIDDLRGQEDGMSFVGQLETARRVVGV